MARAVVRRAAGRVGLRVVDESIEQVVARSFYVPLPDLERLGPEVWDARTDLPGIALDPATQLTWAEATLGAAIAGFPDAPSAPPGPGVYGRANHTYEAVDAEILFAMLRVHRPRRMVELGSGWSTVVAAMALRANRADGHPCRYDVYDPYVSREILPPGHDGVDAQHAVRAQDLDPAVVESLEAGDVLFVDTTHCVQIGGDVNRIVLELLPRLAPGVLVHFHDIWLPYEYHRALFEHLGFRWNEQYLLQAFLSGNPGWEVVFAAQAVARHDPGRLGALVPSYDGSTYPSCFWIRRTGD